MNITIYIDEGGAVTITDLPEELLEMVSKLIGSDRLIKMNTELCG